MDPKNNENKYKPSDLYEEDIYPGPPEHAGVEEGDILKSAGKERLRRLEQEDLEDRKKYDEGRGVSGVTTLPNNAYRNEALNSLLSSNIYFDSTGALLRAADVVARWLAGEDRPEDVPPAAWDETGV